MFTHYEDLLLGMVEEIKKKPAFNVIEFRQGPLGEYLGDEAAALGIIKKLAEVDLDVSMNRCYHRFSDFALYWRSRDNSSLGGEFNLSHLFVSILQGVPAWLTAERWPEEERELHAGFRIFDSQPHGGTGTFAAIRIPSASREPLNPEVWYFDITNGSTKLDIDYCDYLHMLLLTRGCYYWQYLFADPSAVKHHFNNLSSVAKYLGELLDFLSQQFPDQDYTPLRQRLVERVAANS
ncbi:hypothetical protein [Ktedonospora formicarum]|uniref:Uncharacterized protein n=1 Tax=Ktedonospora formicarum TaxID=2778364 RepID=A0A8J3MU71_9CHLR|nr:hypothetical protein [Ktedonospora formicarum]GHO47905.1 hypothetical protein KSX_60680 [Ktedonospora formicarum]